MCKKIVVALLLAVVIGCGGGGSDSGGSGGAVGFTGTDNSLNNWESRTAGAWYEGGDVIFGGLKIEGEWQAERTLNKSGGSNAFVSTANYAVLGIKFDSGYYEYWAEWVLVRGKVVSNAAWTPCGSYGVSQDGYTLAVDANTFTYKSSHTTDPCITVTETATEDEYELCRIGDNN